MFQTLYHLQVFKTRLDIDNEALAKACIPTYNYEKEDHNQADNKDWSDQPLVKHLKKPVAVPLGDPNVIILRKEVKRIIHENIDPRLVEAEMWANVLLPHNTTMIHTHRLKKDWAFLDVAWVYYAANENDSGKFVCQTHVGGTKTINKIIDPRPGDLLIIPSWLPHMTTHNTSEHKRVSISGNYNMSTQSEDNYNEVAYDPNTGIKKLTGFVDE